MAQHQDECCPKFDPAPWEGKTHHWENNMFIKGNIPWKQEYDN